MQTAPVDNAGLRGGGALRRHLRNLHFLAHSRHWVAPVPSRLDGLSASLRDLFYKEAGLRMSSDPVPRLKATEVSENLLHLCVCLAAAAAGRPRPEPGRAVASPFQARGGHHSSSLPPLITKGAAQPAPLRAWLPVRSETLDPAGTPPLPHMAYGILDTARVMGPVTASRPAKASVESPGKRRTPGHVRNLSSLFVLAGRQGPGPPGGVRTGRHRAWGHEA